MLNRGHLIWLSPCYLKRRVLAEYPRDRCHFLKKINLLNRGRRSYTIFHFLQRIHFFYFFWKFRCRGYGYNIHNTKDIYGCHHIYYFKKQIYIQVIIIDWDARNESEFLLLKTVFQFFLYPVDFFYFIAINSDSWSGFSFGAL